MNKNLAKALEDLKAGKIVVLADANDREDEGDLILSVEKASEETLAFLALHARGLMCVACDGETLDRLQLPQMVQKSSCDHGTAFTVSVDAAEGISTGIPVDDRLKTLKVFLDPKSKPEQLARPGHLFPLRENKGGLKERQGHTEASVELMRMAGMAPLAVIIEIMGDDGYMIRGKNLEKYAKKHGLTILAIQDILDYKGIPKIDEDWVQAKKAREAGEKKSA